MSNLLEKASIVLTPTAYDNGSLHSVKPVQTFGSELIDLTQGTAENPSQWSNITTNSVTFLTGASGLRYFNISSTQGTLISGKKYSLILEISNYSGTDTLGVSTQGNVSNNARLNANGTHEEVFVSNGSTLRVFGRATNSATITLSVKEVTDADFDFTRGTAATRVNSQGLIEDVQILSGELVQNGDFSQIGSEEITNGDFATDLSGWQTSGVNATNTITLEPNGVRFVCVDSLIALSQLNVLTVGKAYKLTCDVNVTTGSLGLDGSIIVGSTINFVNGFNEIYFVANSTTFKIKRTSPVSDCLLDNVSVKEVGQNWTLTQATVEDGKLLLSTTDGSYTAATQALGTIGNLYRVSLNVSNIVGTISVAIGGGTDINITTNGTHTFEITSASTTFEVKRKFGNTNVSATIDNVSVIEVTDDTDLPRIDYSPYTGAGTCGHWLLEPQSTNLVTYSEDFSQSSWQKQSAGVASAPIVTSNYSISPDGTLNADRVVFNINAGTTSSDFSQIADQITNNIGDVTNSIWIKSNTTSNYNMSFVDPNANYTSIVVTTEWQRFDATSTTTSTASALRLRLRGSEATSNSADVSVWGAQVEQLTYATSYIPTSGSTATRNADAANNSGSSDLINSTEGVLYAEISALANDGTSRRISLSSGSDANRVSLEIDETSNRIKVFMNGGSISAAIITFDASDLTQFNKIAIKYKSGDVSLFLNGTEVATSTSTNMPVGLNRLNFDGGNGNNDFYGKVKSVAVFKEALTDAELTCLTS